jgi:hypothetical protein
MTWHNPWVWLGTLLVAVPVLIHMLARSSARRQRFPTLRFFDDARIAAVRRSRITDVPLLLVRAAVIVAAVAALAQPYIHTAERRARLSQQVTRIIVVDTSTSMLRATADGRSALAAARAEAAALADAAATIVETAAPGAVLHGAGAALAARSGVREVVVLSDFQTGAVDSLDVASVPAGTGVRLHRIAVDDAPRAARELRSGAYAVSVHDDDGFVWRRRRLPDDSITPAITVLAGAAERAVADAALAAGLADAPAAAHGRRAVVLLPAAEDRAAVLAAARPLDEPWMADAFVAIRGDAALRAAADRVVPGGGRDEAAGDLQPMTDATGALLLVVPDGADGLVIATLVAAAARALAGPPRVRELESAVLPDSVLTQWQRPAVADAAGADAGGSDGRWLWLLALVLLGVETLLRRRTARIGAAQPALGDAA